MGAMARCQETSVQVHPEGWYQNNLKVTSSKELVDGTILQNLNAIVLEDFKEEDVNEEEFLSMEEALPVHVLSDIINKVEDARDLANCMATSKGMSEAVSQVRTLHLVCLKQYYDLARERFPIRQPCPYVDSDEEEEDAETETDDEESDEEDDDDCCEMSRNVQMSTSSHQSSQDTCCAGKYAVSSRLFSSSSQQHPVHVSFKNACLNMLGHVDNVERLRIEVDQEMQANLLLKEEIHMVDFWLSEPMFVRKWVSSCSLSLKHLTLIDYGQQAIMRQSPIIRVLSENCKQLETLELRNMYLDTNDLEELPNVTSLTLRCIKMTEYSLTDINHCMPNVVTLALVSVFGVQEAKLSSQKLEILCLGLSTSAKDVDLDLPKVKKLQLKMTCPDSLHIRAPKLAYVAVCMENRDGSVVEFENVNNLKELLFGASHFSTLARLIRCNPLLEKIFLDVPCMALGEDGKWEGVLPQVPLRVPDVEALKESCPLLHTLSVGPGLWHSMEESFISKQELATFRRWPALSRLIVHMVVLSLETCMSLLEWLLAAVPSLQVLEIYVHTDSPVKIDHLWSACQKLPLHTKLHWGAWKRSLNFACFSF